MPLACDQQDVARRQLGDGGADRLAAISDLNGVGTPRQNGAADRRRLLAARVVVGHEHSVRSRGGDAAHLGALARIAIATATEQRDQAAGGMGAQRTQGLIERIGV